MPYIPREAHDGLMRAWLEILRERHPDVSWIAVEGADPLEEQMESIEPKTTV